MTEVKKKHAGGRPTKFKKEYTKMALALGKFGLTDEQLAEAFNVSVASIYNWKNKHPEFLEALKEGKNFADEKVERALLERATGYTYKTQKAFYNKDEDKVIIADVKQHVAPDATSMIFWLKNRQPEKWRDKQEHNVKLEGEVNLNINISGKVEKVEA